MSRVTNDHNIETGLTWSPDGRQILFNQTGSIKAIADDGSGVAHVLVRGSNASWSRDGRFLVYHVSEPDTGRDLWYLPEGEDDAEPVSWLKSPYNEGAPQMSPDGRYVAFTSDQSGRVEVYVVDFPGGANRTLISTGGGAHPRWSFQGDTLFYLEGDRLMRVHVSTGGALQVDTPEVLFSGEEAGVNLAAWRGAFDVPPYDVHPDGERFVMVGATDDGVVINVVENWFREFEGGQSN